jgi:hypothetical protein
MKLYTGTVWVAAYVSGDGFLAASSNLSDLTNADSALTNLGGTTVGKAVFKAATVAAGQQALDLEVGVDVQAFSPQLTTYAQTGVGMRNRIINGAMQIDQRNDGANVTPTSGQYTVDRWFAGLTAVSKFSLQRNAGAVTPPSGFTNYLGATSLSAYAVLSGDTFAFAQSIEGFNVSDLGWGSASAVPVTLSFWVRSSLTGTFGGSLYNRLATRSYPFGFTINASNTWEQKSITVAGDTTGTWDTDNNTGIALRFGLGSGSTFSGTAGAWTAGNIVQPTGSTSVVGTDGATFYITGVQLEKGSTATSFDYRPYGTELALCQRYFEVDSGGDAFQYQLYQLSTTDIGRRNNISFKITKRTAPTCTLTGGVGSPSVGTATINSLYSIAVPGNATSIVHFSGFTASAEL